LSYYDDQIAAVLPTCPFSGTIANPDANLGAGVSASLSGNGSFGPLTANSSVAVDTKSFNLAIDTGSKTVSQTGVISGNGSLTKKGSGVLTLTANNTYTGDTTVSGGTLIVGDSTRSHSITVTGANSRLFAHSIVTGTLTIGAIASAAAVPEPSIPLLLIWGLIGIIAWVQRQRRI
jgi:fibronectin-binding autotransporter adhesin